MDSEAFHLEDEVRCKALVERKGCNAMQWYNCFHLYILRRKLVKVEGIMMINNVKGERLFSSVNRFLDWMKQNYKGRKK